MTPTTLRSFARNVTRRSNAHTVIKYFSDCLNCFVIKLCLLSVRVWHFTPYSTEKDLGKAYNDYMRLIPDGDAACVRDGDTLFLTPDWGTIIQNYADKHPDAVLVCYTNRIHPLAKEQLLYGIVSQEYDIEWKISLSNHLSDRAYNTTPCTGPLSGFLMVIPKSVWQKVPFREGVGLLGVDTFFYKDLRAAGVPILRMDGLYIWHTYRLDKDIKDTTHLK